MIRAETATAPKSNGIAARALAARPDKIVTTTMWRSQVYFVQDSAGAVKIGYAHDPARRLASLQGCTADTLRFLRVIDGGRPTERWLHKRFSDLRIRGEWFRFDPAMLTVIAPDETFIRTTHTPSGPSSLEQGFEMAEGLGLFRVGSESTLAALLFSYMSLEETQDFVAWARDRVAVLA